MLATSISAVLAGAALIGVAVAIYAAVRQLRAVRRREGAASDARPTFFARPSLLLPNALPHYTPEYPDVVDAYVVLPRSQLRLLTGTKEKMGGTNKAGAAQPGGRHSQHPQQQQQQQQGVAEGARGQEEEAAAMRSSSTHYRVRPGETFAKDAAEDPALAASLHLRKAASIHRGKNRLKESLTLLRKLSSHLVFGRAAYLPREKEPQEAEDVDLPGVMTVASESRTSAAGSSMHVVSL
ncbi:uncharacterized protein Tco025E_02146 [Trypanosoma conorhini]|uniref:Uncharacterized protein n=1 Tax=Trypanosoma conorhini TaxID=83891 RepID=A0A3R7PIC8_9TRYP|nr:uncharacterized protein Tco025E_02146 [Trypanosoma conorhini]RNF25709.1 hypothetical protein Tco025E_02146 [Trypanosoma conorhini]